MISGLFELIVFSIVLMILFVAFSRSMRKRNVPPRRHRPLLLRWLCGVTGTLLVGGLVYGTIRSARFPYQLSPAPEQLISGGTVALTDADLTSENVDVLFQYVLGLGDLPDFLPLEIKEVRVPLQKKADSFGATFLEEGNPIRMHVTLNGSPHLLYHSHPPVYLNRTLTQHGPGHYMSSRTGSVNTGQRFRVVDNSYTTLFHHPYSLFSRHHYRWIIVESVTLLHPEDEGQKVSAEDYIEDMTAELSEMNSSYSRHSHLRSEQAGFAGLMNWTGPAFLLLFVAAGLWAQCFARRGTGFTVCMTVLIALTVLLDRNNQRFHQQQADNMERLSPHRELASRLSENSFFFRDTE